MRHVLGIVPTVMILHTILHIFFSLFSYSIVDGPPEYRIELGISLLSLQLHFFSVEISIISLISFFLWPLPYIILLVKLNKVKVPHLLKSQILALYFPQGRDQKLDQVSRYTASLKPLEAHLKSHDDLVAIE